MATPKTLTTKQVIAGFRVGHMTVYNWRKGTATMTPLPCTVEYGRVSYDTKAVEKWAKANDRKFTAPDSDAEVTKPGPKPKVKPEAEEPKAAKTPRVSKDQVAKPSKMQKAIAAVARKTAKRAKANAEQPQA